MLWKSKKPPVSESDMQEIITTLREKVANKPPTIGLVGVSGVGKSSTINSMFKTNLPISHTKACTKEFQAIDLELDFMRGNLSGDAVSLRVIDAPGLGESIYKDPEYIAEYNKNLPNCDVIFWIMSARNRAISLDQMYLEQLRDHHSKIVFAINQCDLVEPLNWKDAFNIPSREQDVNIKEIIEDRRGKIKEVINLEPKIVLYSASKGYNLELLFKTFLESCSPDRRWIYFSLKNFSYKDFAFKGLKKLFKKS